MFKLNLIPPSPVSDQITLEIRFSITISKNRYVLIFGVLTAFTIPIFILKLKKSKSG